MNNGAILQFLLINWYCVNSNKWIIKGFFGTCTALTVVLGKQLNFTSAIIRSMIFLVSVGFITIAFFSMLTGFDAEWPIPSRRCTCRESLKLYRKVREWHYDSDKQTSRLKQTGMADDCFPQMRKPSVFQNHVFEKKT